MSRKQVRRVLAILAGLLTVANNGPSPMATEILQRRKR